MHKRVIAGSTLVLLLSLSTVRADDGAASIAAGGIVMKRESRIVMAKEILKISEDKVIVDYDFRNDTDADITSEVAFPIPNYSLNPDGAEPKEAGFDDFKLSIDGKPARYAVQVRALVGNKDMTPMLSQMHVDIASMGHYFWPSGGGPTFPDIDRLSKSQLHRLASLKLVDEDGTPLWSVQKKCYWTQVFPAHGIVHIHHEYKPVLGSLNSVSYGLTGDDPAAKKELGTLCVDPSLRRSLITLVDDPHAIVPYSYVDFILTTANTWKTPIEDFTLIVERPHLKDTNQNYVSFCWSGPVEKVDADHFIAHTTNLIPKNELRIGFISVAKFKN